MEVKVFVVCKCRTKGNLSRGQDDTDGLLQKDLDFLVRVFVFFFSFWGFLLYRLGDFYLGPKSNKPRR